MSEGSGSIFMIVFQPLYNDLSHIWAAVVNDLAFQVFNRFNRFRFYGNTALFPFTCTFYQLI